MPLSRRKPVPLRSIRNAALIVNMRSRIVGSVLPTAGSLGGRADALRFGGYAHTAGRSFRPARSRSICPDVLNARKLRKPPRAPGTVPEGALPHKFIPLIPSFGCVMVWQTRKGQRRGNDTGPPCTTNDDPTVSGLARSRGLPLGVALRKASDLTESEAASCGSGQQYPGTAPSSLGPAVCRAWAHTPAIRREPVHALAGCVCDLVSPMETSSGTASVSAGAPDPGGRSHFGSQPCRTCAAEDGTVSGGRSRPGVAGGSRATKGGGMRTGAASLARYCPQPSGAPCSLAACHGPDWVIFPVVAENSRREGTREFRSYGTSSSGRSKHISMTLPCELPCVVPEPPDRGGLLVTSRRCAKGNPYAQPSGWLTGVLFLPHAINRAYACPRWPQEEAFLRRSEGNARTPELV